VVYIILCQYAAQGGRCLPEHVVTSAVAQLCNLLLAGAILVLVNADLLIMHKTIVSRRRRVGWHVSCADIKTEVCSSWPQDAPALLTALECHPTWLAHGGFAVACPCVSPRAWL
jgi:hypothetical protein